MNVNVAMSSRYPDDPDNDILWTSDLVLPTVNS